jgi:hypothetical protein
VLNFVSQIASSGIGKSPAGVGFKRAKFHARAVDEKVQNRVSKLTSMSVGLLIKHQHCVLNLKHNKNSHYYTAYYIQLGERVHKEATFMTEWVRKNLIPSNDDRRTLFFSLFSFGLISKSKVL